jgi:hypothetical protein
VAGPLTLLRDRLDRPGGGRFAPWFAAPLIAAMAAAAVLMGFAIYYLTDRAITASQLAAKRLGGPLVMPAPGTAGGLPRRIGAITDPAVLAIVRE